MLHSRYINGNLAFWDTHQNRIVDAIGAGVNKFIEEFQRFNSGDYTITEVGDGSGTQALTDGVGGHLLITNSAADNDETEMQKKGESFKLVAGKPCYFGCCFKVNDATQSDLYIGLGITDATSITAASDGVTFRKDDGDANIDTCTEKNSTETKADSGVDLANDTFITMEFFFDGNGTVYFYIDGVLKATVTTNIPDDEELTPTFAIMNGEAVAKTTTIDWIRAIQFN